VTTITPLADRCGEWLEDNVAIQRFGISVAIEPHYIEHLAEAMVEEGLIRKSEEPAEED
jgi:hypothetical protein